MSATATSRARTIAAATLLLVAGLAPTAAAQSLADLAKKEEDRRRATPAPAKVYTNKDLSAVPAGSPPPAAAPEPTTPSTAPPAKSSDPDAKADGSKAGAAKDNAPVKDEAYWAGRLKTLQDGLARDQNYADAMQTRINVLTTDFVNRDDPAQRSVIEQNRQKSLAELARLTKNIQDTKKAIADFFEEARRAGVPPGWLR